MKITSMPGRQCKAHVIIFARNTITNTKHTLPKKYNYKHTHKTHRNTHTHTHTHTNTNGMPHKHTNADILPQIYKTQQSLKLATPLKQSKI